MREKMRVRKKEFSREQSCLFLSVMTPEAFAQQFLLLISAAFKSCRKVGNSGLLLQRPQSTRFLRMGDLGFLSLEASRHVSTAAWPVNAAQPYFNSRYALVQSSAWRRLHLHRSKQKAKRPDLNCTLARALTFRACCGADALRRV